MNDTEYIVLATLLRHDGLSDGDVKKVIARLKLEFAKIKDEKAIHRRAYRKNLNRDIHVIM